MRITKKYRAHLITLIRHFNNPDVLARLSKRDREAILYLRDVRKDNLEEAWDE